MDGGSQRGTAGGGFGQEPPVRGMEEPELAGGERGAARGFVLWAAQSPALVWFGLF